MTQRRRRGAITSGHNHHGARNIVADLRRICPSRRAKRKPCQDCAEHHICQHLHSLTPPPRRTAENIFTAYVLYITTTLEHASTFLRKIVIPHRRTLTGEQVSENER